MFHKILVALDDSKLSETVFKEALALAEATQAQLLLLHVLSPEDLENPGITATFVPYYYPVISDTVIQEYRRRWKAAEDRGIEMLQAFADRAAARGIVAEFTQNLGDPSRLICTLAKNWEADLIILGRRGHTGFSEFLLGSVSNYVVHHAPCSVLTVQGSKAAPEPQPEAVATTTT